MEPRETASSKPVDTLMKRFWHLSKKSKVIHPVARFLQLIIGHARSTKYRVNSFLFDKYFNVETRKKLDRKELDLPVEYKRLAWSYEPVDTNRFKRSISSINIERKDYIYIDIGSGKGKTLFLADQIGFNNIIGIEFSQTLHDIALKNLSKYRSKTKSISTFNLINCNALTFSFPNKPLLIYLFNPFMDPTFSRFIYNLSISLKSCRRDIVILYTHPTEKSVFDNYPQFIKIHEDNGKDDFIIYRAITKNPAH